jgi:NitT/TauT family transport system ATP-binding protein
MSLHVRGLSKAYAGRTGDVSALQEVTFSVADREFVCIVGPSGCGKSTLLKVLAGLLEPDAGTVVADPEPDNGRPQNALVFQEHGLFPWLTVLGNVAFGLRMRGMPRRAAEEKAASFIARVGLAAFARSYPHELSVGMRERVNLARAFLVDPRMLLMDEPFGSLDAQTRLVLQQELLQTWERTHKTVIYVTHDIEEAVLMGDRVLVMSGRPGYIRDDIPVDLPRPRDLVHHSDPIVAELEERIWIQLEDEVRKSLCSPR